MINSNAIWVHFSYRNGGNPYISWCNNGLFHMICKYYLTPSWFNKNAFIVEGYRNKDETKTYNDKKEALRDFAIIWQEHTQTVNLSWDDLIKWGAFFKEYGKKYGLLREFRENGIC